MTISIKPTASGSTIEQDGSTILTVDGSGNITPSNNLYPKVPAFRAYLGASQNITSGVYTKVAFNVENFDATSVYDTTNYRFTPTVAGYYNIIHTIRFDITSGATTAVVGNIYKNGTRYSINFIDRTGQADSTITSSDILYLNGTTDYVEIYGLIIGTSPFFEHLNSDNTCFFSGHLVSV